MFYTIESLEIDLYDLSNADKNTLHLVGEMIWQLKSLYLLLAEDQNVFFQQYFNDDLKRVFRSKKVNILPQQILKDVWSQWLPNLAKEVSEYKSGKKAKTQFLSV